jgi:hypothetical protein
METDKGLEEKLQDAESTLVGIGDQLKGDRFGYADAIWHIYVQDVKCLETNEYQVVAAKWRKEMRTGPGRYFEPSPSLLGIEWEEWTSVYFRRKKSEKDNRVIETERVKTRDLYDSSKNKTELWPYKFVEVYPLEPTEIEVVWVNKEGDKGLTYIVDLESDEVLTE